jgi:hypothetical protein
MREAGHRRFGAFNVAGRDGSQSEAFDAAMEFGVEMLGDDLADRAKAGDRNPPHIVFGHLGKSPG